MRHQNDGTVILQKGLVEVCDGPVGFAFPHALLLVGGVGHLVGVVDEVVGVADAFPDAVVGQRARGIRRGSLRPHGHIGVRRALIVVVYHALPLEVADRAEESRHHVAAAYLERRLEMIAVGHVPVERASELVGLDVRLVEVVGRRLALGNHIEEIARGEAERQRDQYK